MNVTAIDVHIHLNDELANQYRGARSQQMASYFRHERAVVSIDELADFYREREMMAVIMNTDNESISGAAPLPNDHIASAVKDHPDVFLGFAAIDPWQGRRALAEMRRAKELGLTGIGELHPPSQQFYPNDPRFYPLWEEASKLQMPILFHCGMAGTGAGTPGGMGIKLKYSQPLLVDDIAADFPELKLICAHPSWPWQEESLAMALHKANVFLDLSGWAPKYFPPQLVQYMNTILQDKVLFGSDSPAISLDRWIQEFGEITLKPEVRRKILLDNAVKFFGLELGAQPSVG